MRTVAPGACFQNFLFTFVLSHDYTSRTGSTLAQRQWFASRWRFCLFFEAYAEAEAEVGVEVAQAWQACRRRVQQGLGASVKELMEKEATPVVLAPAQAKSLPVIRPTTAAGKPAVSFGTIRGFAESCSTGYQPETWPGRGPGRWGAGHAAKVAAAGGSDRGSYIEERAQATWLELERWTADQGWNPRFLSASQFANYYQSCASPSRVLNACAGLVSTCILVGTSLCV